MKRDRVQLRAIAARGGCVAVVALLGGCADHPAADARLAGPVAESVNGEPVSGRLLDAFARAHNLDLAQPPARARALSQLADMALLAQAARRAGYLDDPDVAAAAEVGRLQALAGATMKKFQEAAPVAAAAVRAEYDREAAAGGAREYDFDQVAFASREEAAAAVTAISGGRTFEQIMQAHKAERMARSFTAVRGSHLPGPVVAALDTLQPGRTTAPVQLGRGWVLLRLGAIRTVAMPAFEQASEGIRLTLERRAAEQRMSALRADAKITLALAPPPVAAAHPASTTPPPVAPKP
jgi:hypothetical protein